MSLLFPDIPARSTVPYIDTREIDMREDKETRKRREFVAGMYTGPRWKSQVAKMPAHQITAIYLRTQQDEPPKPKLDEPQKPPDQLRLDL